MKTLYFTLILLLASCSQKKEEEILSDFIQMNKISNVIMNNYSGEFELNESQLKQFKIELGKSKYKPNMSYKLGGVSFEIILDGKKYNVFSNSKSSYLEFPNSIITKTLINSTNNYSYFETNGLNLHNYKPE